MKMRSDKNQALLNKGVKRFSTCVMVMILLSGLVLCRLVNSGELDHADAGLIIIGKHIQEASDSVDKWNNDWRIMITIVGTIGILGVVTSLIQGAQGKWVKNVTLCIGGIISALTVINNTVYDVDHRTQSKIISKAKSGIYDLESLKYQYGIATTDETRSKLVGQSAAKLSAILNLSQQSSSKSETAAIGLSSLAFAGTSLGHAGAVAPPPPPPPPPPPREPRWVTTVPADKEHFYFRGIGESSDLQEAAERSFQDAVGRAEAYFSQQLDRAPGSKHLNLDHVALAEHLVKSSLSKNLTNYSIYEASRNTYRYHTLLILDRKILRLNLQSFGFVNKIDIPTKLSDTIVKADQPSE